jgi:hypothetical protein
MAGTNDPNWCFFIINYLPHKESIGMKPSNTKFPSMEPQMKRFNSKARFLA